MASENEPIKPPPLAALDEFLAGEEVAVGSEVPAGIPGRATSERVQKIIAYIALTLIAALFFVPFLWSLSTSLKPLPETANFSLLPHTWTLAGYREVWTKFDFARYMGNSALLAGTITFSSVFLASLGGYAFARLRFPGRRGLTALGRRAIEQGPRRLSESHHARSPGYQQRRFWPAIQAIPRRQARGLGRCRARHPRHCR